MGNLLPLLVFPGDASGKEPACQYRRHKRQRIRFYPWVGKIPWMRRWQLCLPFWHSCLENPLDRIPSTESPNWRVWSDNFINGYILPILWYRTTYNLSLKLGQIILLNNKIWFSEINFFNQVISFGKANR